MQLIGLEYKPEYCRLIDCTDTPKYTEFEVNKNAVVVVYAAVDTSEIISIDSKGF